MRTQTQVQALPYHAYHAPPARPSYTTPSSYLQQQHLDSPYSDSRIRHSNDYQSTDAYMNPSLPQPPLQHSFQSSPQHGIKRSAPDPEDELERSSHISTQFKKLRLNNNQQPQPSENYNVAGLHDSSAHAHTSSHKMIHSIGHPAYQAAGQIPPELHPLASNDFMTVDETPHKVYISDLDSEIASIEAAEQSSSQIFLPDFEKQISAIPDHVLRSNRAVYGGEQGESSNSNNQALVLYKDPSSISVPAEEDAVKKAILEARRGIRERMRREQQRERETAHVDLAAIREAGSTSKALPESRSSGKARIGRYNDLVRNDEEWMLDDGDAMDIE